jgi:uncharacterized protein YbaR (Trm112 family)
MSLDELMKILACPKCKGDVKLKRDENKIICNSCRLKFPILKGDIPDMLIEDAEHF